jgi:dCMP deaminase
METARLMARRSTCSERVAVGAVLSTKDRRVVATGYNGSPAGMPHCDNVGCVKDDHGHCLVSVHAEVNAILQCAYNGVQTRGLILYCTHSPCVRCASIICQAGIQSVIFGEIYRESEHEIVMMIFNSCEVVVKQYRGDNA